MRSTLTPKQMRGTYYSMETVEESRSQSSPLGCCWHGWKKATVSSVIFGHSGPVIIEKFPVLLGCPFPSVWATESRLVGTFFLSARWHFCVPGFFSSKSGKTHGTHSHFVL